MKPCASSNSTAGTVHLLLTDVIMPLMSGRELVKRVRFVKPATKVVYMSGYTDDTLAFHGFSQQNNGFIQKPFNAAVLAEKIRKVLSEDDDGSNGHLHSALDGTRSSS